MTVKEKIEAIAAQLTIGVASAGDWTFYTDQSEEFNKNDDAVSPFLFMDRPLRISGKVDNKVGIVFNTYAVNLFFGGNKPQLDQPQEDREANMKTMGEASNQFLRLLINDGWAQVTDWSGFEGYNALDMNCDGWYLNVRLKVNDTIC